MQAVLMSMKPEWWEKILDGEKTLEIRKTHPQNERLEWPVTVLVYVSGTGAVQGQFLCPGEVSYRTMQDLEETLDGKAYKVKSCTEEAGVLAIELEAVRS